MDILITALIIYFGTPLISSCFIAYYLHPLKKTTLPTFLIYQTLQVFARK